MTTRPMVGSLQYSYNSDTIFDGDGVFLFFNNVKSDTYKFGLLTLFSRCNSAMPIKQNPSKQTSTWHELNLTEHGVRVMAQLMAITPSNFKTFQSMQFVNKKLLAICKPGDYFISMPLSILCESTVHFIRYCHQDEDDFVHIPPGSKKT
jgi:hypothetical protein